MLVYYYLYFIFFLMTIWSLSSNKQADTYLSILFCAILFVFNYIRGDVGTDYHVYKQIIDAIGVDGIEIYSYLEPGFRYTIFLVSGIADGSVHVFGFFGLIILLLLYLGLIKLNLNVCLSLLLYFSLFYIGYLFNGLRQGIAMSFFVFALKDICEGNNKRVFVFSMLASLFHFSGVFILISLFIKKFDIKYIAGFFVFCLIISFFNFSSVFFSLFSSEFILSKFNSYSNLSEQSGLSQVFLRLLVLIACLYIYKNSSGIKYIKDLIKIIIIGHAFFFVFIDLNVFATRINMFFRIVEIVVVSIYVSNNEKLILNRFLVLVSFLILYFMQFVIVVSIPENNYIVNEYFY